MRIAQVYIIPAGVRNWTSHNGDAIQRRSRYLPHGFHAGRGDYPGCSLDGSLRTKDQRLQQDAWSGRLEMPVLALRDKLRVLGHLRAPKNISSSLQEPPASLCGIWCCRDSNLTSPCRPTCWGPMTERGYKITPRQRPGICRASDLKNLISAFKELEVVIGNISSYLDWARAILFESDD